MSDGDVPAVEPLLEGSVSGAPHPAGVGSSVRPPSGHVDRLIGLVGLVDRVMAQAILVLRDGRGTGEAERKSGLPVERLVSLATGATGADVRFLSRAERLLVNLPTVDRAFQDGRLSWSQVRGIVTAAKGLRVGLLAEFDSGVGAEVGRGEPDRIVQRAFGWAMVLLEPAEVDGRDPGEHRTFRVQPDLFGGAVYSGYDRLDAVTTILEAVEAAADRPVAADQVRGDAEGRMVPAGLLPATARQAQLADGLRLVCTAYLSGSTASSDTDHAGGSSGGRVRPSITVVVDHTDLLGSTGRALARWQGGPVRLTRLTTDRLLCDPSLSVVVTDSGRPVAVGDATAPITSRHRRVLFAVDRGCRMPGCWAPVQHADAHHVIPRKEDGETSTDNLVLLCRSCHVMSHKQGMTMALERHTRAVTLTIPDGRTFTSIPA